jgi:hypothetical protein
MNDAPKRSHPFHLTFSLALVGNVFCAAGLAGYDVGNQALLLAEDQSQKD